MVKIVPKYQKYLRVRRGPRRDWTKLYRVSKKYSTAFCKREGRMRMERVADHTTTPIKRTARKSISIELDTGSSMPPGRGMENKWGAACSNPCSAPSSAAQALPPITPDTVNAANHRNWKNLLIVCLLPLLVPTPVNTGKRNPFPLFDGFDCGLSSLFWQAQNSARTQIIYICT